MALNTVADVIADARRLLQDNVAPYRYSDTDIVSSLNDAVIEARRIRPDMFMVQARSDTVPSYSAGSPSTALTEIPIQYRMSFVYYVVGLCALSDDEANEDSRATVFMNKFVSQLAGGVA